MKQLYHEWFWFTRIAIFTIAMESMDCVETILGLIYCRRLVHLWEYPCRVTVVPYKPHPHSTQVNTLITTIQPASDKTMVLRLDSIGLEDLNGVPENFSSMTTAFMSPAPVTPLTVNQWRVEALWCPGRLLDLPEHPSSFKILFFSFTLMPTSDIDDSWRPVVQPEVSARLCCRYILITLSSFSDFTAPVLNIPLYRTQ